MQNQQLGGRVYSRVYSSVCRAVQHIEEIIQAQAASSMVARFEARRDRAISIYGQRDNSREDNKLSENIYIHCLFVETLFLRKTCREAFAASSSVRAGVMFADLSKRAVV